MTENSPIAIADSKHIPIDVLKFLNLVSCLKYFSYEV